MKFIFKAKDKQGAVKEGKVEASSGNVAAEVLQRNGLFPISIKEEKTQNTGLEKILKYFDQVSEKEKMIFFRQLAILIEAKVPIVASLGAIKDQSENRYFKSVLDQMMSDIQEGMALSATMTRHQDIFSGLHISVVKTGEVSGNLKKSVEYVADNIEKNYALVSKIRSAMIYPVVVLIVFFIIAFIVISFVVPKLTTMIKELDAEVPWYTNLVIKSGDFMASYWWVVAVIILGFIGGIIYYIRTDDGKKEWDQVKIKLPIFGKIFQYIYITRFSENLAVLLSGGIPIIDALKVVSKVVNSNVYEKIIVQAAEEVKVGGDMSDVFKRYPEIPPIVSQMVRIGEESGQIDVVLRHVADFYSHETEEITKNLSTLIEPLLMVLIGIFVGFLAFSVIMPIYNLAGQL